MRIRHNILLALAMIFLGVTILSPLFYLSAKAVVNPKLTLSKMRSTDVSNINNFLLELNDSLDDDTSLKYNSKTDTNNGSDKVVKCRFLLASNSSHISDTFTLEINRVGYTENGTLVAGYDSLDTSSKQTVVSYAFSALDKSKISRTNKVKIYNFIYNNDETTASLVRQLSSDVKADYVKGYSYLKPFSGAISTVLGVIVIIIFTLLAFTMILDIAYLNIPLFQMFLLDHSKAQAHLVSKEAIEASQKSSTYNDSTLKSPMYVYMTSKTKQMFMMFLCLLYLLSGQIYTLLAHLLDMFNSFIGA